MNKTKEDLYLQSINSTANLLNLTYNELNEAKQQIEQLTIQEKQWTEKVDSLYKQNLSLTKELRDTKEENAKLKQKAQKKVSKKDTKKKS